MNLMGFWLPCSTWLARIQFGQQGYPSQRKTQAEIKWESIKIQFSPSYNQTQMTTQVYSHFKVRLTLIKNLKMTKELK